MRIRGHFNYNGTKGLTFKKPSLTVPDEAYTVKELYEKYSSNQIALLEREGIYEEEFDLTRMQDFDYSDLTAITEQIQDREDSRKKLLSKYEEKMQKIKREQQIKAAVDTELKKRKTEEIQPSTKTIAPGENSA
ncbi:hypothetical protein [Microviridae sp.]|nr:hypothetical protein [Microviridae sp.]